MINDKYITDFFLGCPSYGGFVSLFEQLTDEQSPYRTYILKGGPGCGKSTLMRLIAKKLSERGWRIELIHCASDPDSLDGVICRDRYVAVIDGTSPHIVEPRYPAARERVVSLYGYLDEGKLAPHLAEISGDLMECARLQERAARFSGAASGLLLDVERTAKACLKRDKLNRYLGGLASRLLPKYSTRQKKEQLRFSGAFTPLGLINYSEINASKYTNCYIFSDKYCASSRYAMSYLRRQALTAGYEVIACRSPLFPDDGYDSLYLPELSLCFLSDGFFSSAEKEGAQVIHEGRFYDTDRLRANSKRFAFTKKAAASLLSENAALMSAAKERHDRAERYYSCAADFRAIERLGGEVIRDILSR